MRKRAPETPVIEAEWLAVAAKAREELDRSPHGNKREAINRLAAKAGIGDGLLRRAIAAHRFLDTLDDAGVTVPPELRRAPIGVVDIVSRWAEHDRSAAFAAGTAYVRGDLPFRDLLKKEVAARPAGTRTRPARMIDVYQAWKDEVVDRLPRLTVFMDKEIQDPSAGDPPVDAWVKELVTGVRLGAIVIVGPYVDDAGYTRDRENWIFRTIGVHRIVGHIWLVVPTSEQARAYQDRLDHWSIPNEDIVVLPLIRPPSVSTFIGPRREVERKKPRRSEASRSSGRSCA